MRPEYIHTDDDMFHRNVEHYNAVGSQMAAFAVEASNVTGVADPLVLELPCGYGRVTRHLVRYFEPE